MAVRKTLSGGWRYYRYCGQTIRSAIPLPPLRTTRPAAAASTVTVEGSRDRLPRAPEWFHHWRLGGTRRLSFARVGDGYLLRVPNVADFLVSHDGARVSAIGSVSLPDDTLRHLLVDQVLPLALSRRGLMLLHASAVHVRGLGVLAFAGAAGRGKSTLAGALASGGARLLSDDCVALEREGSCVWAHPSYPGLRLWDDSRGRAWRTGTADRRVAHYTDKRRVSGGEWRFQARPAPLRAIFIVAPRAAAGPAAAIRRARASASVVALQRCTFVLDVGDRAQLARTFDDLAAIALAVPVLRLRVRDGQRFLMDAAEALVAAAAAVVGCAPAW